MDFVVDFYLSKADAPRLLNNSRLQSKRGQGSPNMYFLSMNTRTPALAKPSAQPWPSPSTARTIVQHAGASPGPATGPSARASSGSSTRRPATRGSTPSPWTGPRPSSARPGWGPPHPALRLRRHPASDGARQIIRDSLRQLGLTVDLQPLETG